MARETLREVPWTPGAGEPDGWRPAGWKELRGEYGILPLDEQDAVWCFETGAHAMLEALRFKDELRRHDGTIKVKVYGKDGAIYGDGFVSGCSMVFIPDDE